MMQPSATTQVVVKSFDGRGNATCQTQMGGSMTIPLALRNGKGGWPQIGETWIVTQEHGQWMFTVLVNSTGPEVLFIDRTDPADASLKVVDALVALGLAIEEDSIAPALLGDTAFTPSADGDAYSVASGEIIQVPLWLGTYNTGGSSRLTSVIHRDIVRMLKSQVDIFGLQEMFNGGTPGFRDDIITYLKAAGYAVVRWETGDSTEWNWIVYNTAKMTLVNSDIVQLTEGVANTAQIARYAVWGQFQHLASGQRFTFINTHLPPPARWASHYYTDQVKALAALATSLESWGPLYLVGDFNVGYNVSPWTSAGYPGTSVFTSVPLTSNWATQTPPAGLGTQGTSLIDHVFKGPDPGGLGSFNQVEILQGCFSGHRPLLVEVILKRKDTDMLQ